MTRAARRLRALRAAPARRDVLPGDGAPHGERAHTQSAYSHTYTWKASTGESRWSYQVCIVQRGTGFVLTGTTGNSPGLPARTAIIRQIINSIRIVAKPQVQPPANPTKPTSPGGG